MASRPGENVSRHSSSHAKQSASSVWRETHQPFVHFLVASVAVLLWCSVKRHFIALLHWSAMDLRAQMSSEADEDSSYSLFLTSVFLFSYISLTIIMANLLSWPLPPTPQISFSLALNLNWSHRPHRSFISSIPADGRDGRDLLSCTLLPNDKEHEPKRNEKICRESALWQTTPLLSRLHQFFLHHQ